MTIKWRSGLLWPVGLAGLGVVLALLTLRPSDVVESPDKVVTPGALLLSALILAMRELRDHPTVQVVEQTNKAQQDQINELRRDRQESRDRISELETQVKGLTIVASQRVDFQNAISAMADVARGIAVVNERISAHSQATSEEHTQFLAAQRETTAILREIRDDMRHRNHELDAREAAAKQG